MKKIIQLSLILLIKLNFVTAQSFQVDTLQLRGNLNKYINLVIMGDGYISTEQDSFISDAVNLVDYLFTQPPWSNYKNYFNVFAIKVISNQSGAKHPNTAGDCSNASPQVPVSNSDTYLGCSFDSYGIHRLVVPFNTSNIVNALATNFPNYDQVFIISNTTYYGGSGGVYATATVNISSNEIVAHEIGHSFAYLADEYYAGDMYAKEKPNMTKETDSTLVKWKNWNGYSGVGIFQHCCGGNSSLWYKPHTGCKMQYLGYPYCSVCTETIIEKTHFLANPIVSYQPIATTIDSSTKVLDFKLTELMKPVPNTLKSTWKLDGATISNNTDSIQLNQDILSNGMHTLTTTVIDTTFLLRVDTHSTIHFSVVSWNINKKSTGIQLTATKNKISYSVFPNPSTSNLNVSLEYDKKSKLSLQVISSDGRIIEQITDETSDNGKYFKTFSIDHFAKGNYVIVFKSGDIIHTKTFVKQ
ncbi:MAG: hypothetical protein A3H98_05105 [Bacteroidetes bacterium RIFCSPLOWO2_02_FULL_36_8]|nr:MAG: hypothetical protein A3H98_05105 [Bacteroidetes bacterium RIFCSPLOWO2_02_FULL_36_8]OFY70197.1 MAG: hypothetical protein A3G23_08600 [Bacteroidetes bacterium RIFCSPLOWO2_12_FULL_37_12]